MCNHLTKTDNRYIFSLWNELNNLHRDERK